MQARIAWRNIWRNPKRTMVILAAVVVGVWSLIVFSGLSLGMLESMKDNGIRTLTGHVQIHAQGFRQDPSIEHSIAEMAAVRLALAKVLPARAVASERVRVAAIVSNARHSSGITLVGMDPRQEAQVSFLGQSVTDGRMLTQDDSNGVIVGRALLQDFDTRLGHKLVLMSQDTNNLIASRAFRIVGVYDAELEAVEKQFVFVLKSSAQNMLALGDAISEVCILLPRSDLAEPTARDIRQALGDQGLEAATWQDLLPLVSLYLSVFDSYMYLWWLVVFMAMGFGIVNTMLMAVLERIREFGLLKALGMRPAAVLALVLSEALFLLLVGLIAGNLLGAATIHLLARTGLDLSALAQGSEYVGMSRVIYPVLDLKTLFTGNAMVLILGLAVCLYPALKAARITPVKALAHV